jgi:hypothetical protein
LFKSYAGRINLVTLIGSNPGRLASMPGGPDSYKRKI